ncbi:MAG: hypothetical protein ACE14V_08460 [bacterium]
MKTNNLKSRVMELIVNESPITISALANKMKINRVFLAGYLQALEEMGELESINIGPAKIFKVNNTNQM